MSDVNVSIGATVSELKAGLGEAGKMLKDFRKDEKAEGKSVAFFTQELQNIAGAAGGASNALGLMLGGLAAGGPMGLAQGAAKALFEAITQGSESTKQAAQRAEEFKKQLQGIREASEAAEKNLRKLEAQQRGMSSATAEAVFGSDQQKRDEARATLQQRLNELLRIEGRERETHVELQDDLLLSSFEEQALGKAAVSDNKEVKDLKRQIAEIDAENGRAQGRAKAENNLTHKKNIESLAVQKVHLDGQVQALGAYTDKQRIQLERDTTLAEIEAKRKYAANADDLAKLDQEAQYAKAIADEKLRILQYETEMKQQRDAILNKDQDFASLEAPAFGASAEAPEVTRARQLAKEREKKDLAERLKAYEDWSERVGEVVGQAITGSVSPARAAGALIKDVLRTFLDAERKQIVASALGAGAKAADSPTAGIPFAGPALAAAAMASMISLVMGLLGSLPSARGGMDLPDFTGGALAVLHGGEQVLPRELAERIRNMTDEPQHTRGGGTNITIQAVDGQSVERLASDNSSSFSRALVRDQRRRRPVR